MNRLPTSTAGFRRDGAPAESSRRWGGLIQLCGLLVFGFGITALVGWTTGWPLLASFEPGRIPMAPSTAILFLFYGTALFLETLNLLGSRTRWISPGLASCGAIFSLLLLFLSTMDIQSSIEHLGLDVTGKVNGAPIGHISPLTAFCFLLAGSSLLLGSSSSSNRRGRAKVAFLAAFVTLLIGTILTVAYLLGGPLLYGSGIIPPALTTSLAFLLLGTGLLATASGRVWPAEEWRGGADHGVTYILALIFVLTAAGIITASYVYFRNYQQHFLSETERQLSTATVLKVGDLSQWRRERMGDAAMFFDNENFSARVRRWLEKPDDPDVRNRVRTWLAKVQFHGQYKRVFLLDSQGVPRISIPDSEEPVSSFVVRSVSEVQRTGRIVFPDFHRPTPEGPVCLYLMAPIKDEADNEKILGVLVFQIDPETYVFPLLRRWPVPSQTAETLLVRREGNESLILNDLKVGDHTALNRRFSIQTREVRTGILEGVDYRGVSVLVDIRVVPDSPWFLVSSIDTAEAYAHAQAHLWVLVGIVAVLLVGTGAGAGLFWWHQRISFYKDRYEAAEALRQSEERYRNTLDRMLEGCQIIDHDWRILYINDAAALHGRRQREELQGTRIMDVYPGIENTDMFAALRRCMTEHEALRVENEFVFSPGDSAWFELGIQSVPEGLFILSLDITERKRIESILEKSEKTLRTIFSSIRDGIIGADVATRKFVLVNEAICRMLGHSRDQMLNFGVKDIHPERDLPYVATQFERGATGETTLVTNIPVLRKDGVVFYADISITLIEFSGRPCLIGVFRDITERKLAEDRITHLNRVLRAVRYINQLIVRERSPDLLIRKACDLLVKHRSYSSAIIVLVDETNHPTIHAHAGFDEDVRSLIPLLDRGELPPCTHDAQLTNEVYLKTDRREDCHACPMAAGHADMVLLCIALRSEDIVFGYLLVTMQPGAPTDAEEQDLFVEMADDLAYSLHAMRIQSAGEQSERERKSLEGQLFQAQKMEAVGRLAGGVAHDFNNMLQTIMGNAELVLGEIEPGNPLREYIEEIQKATDRSADLTRQLLAFARKQTIAPKILDLNDTIATLLKMLRRLIGEDIDLVWKPAGNLWPVKMDPTQVNQIMANLVVNARDAILGVGRIVIETESMEFGEISGLAKPGFLPGKYAMLAVSDNGMGMDTQTKERIFEPFFTTKAQGRGTGLGLAMVYGIVKQNEGFINVYSEPGQGTTFRIYLPRHEDEVADTRQPRESAKNPTGTETILLVEDDEMLLKLARRMLESLGYTVLAAGGPRQALQLVAEQKAEYNLLITDVVMPEMSGRELWQQLKAIQPTLKCLFVSGYTANVITHHGVLEPEINFLPKPFSLKILAEKIREMLGEI